VCEVQREDDRRALEQIGLGRLSLAAQGLDLVDPRGLLGRDRAPEVRLELAEDLAGRTERVDAEDPEQTLRMGTATWSARCPPQEWPIAQACSSPKKSSTASASATCDSIVYGGSASDGCTPRWV
jgi:hypothetical protein